MSLEDGRVPKISPARPRLWHMMLKAVSDLTRDYLQFESFYAIVNVLFTGGRSGIRTQERQDHCL